MYTSTYYITFQLSLMLYVNDTMLKFKQMFNFEYIRNNFFLSTVNKHS